MYLPSKTKLKLLSASLLFIFLIILPFKDFIQQTFIFLVKRPFYFSAKEHQETLKHLKEENLKLQLEIKEASSLKKENRQLRQALKLKLSKKAALLAAEIIAFVPSSWDRQAILNVGENRGVEKGLFAIDENGNLLGKVIEVSPKSSRLILSDDPDFQVSVFVGEKAFGLLQGTLSGAKVLYIEDGSKIKVGDKVWMKIATLASALDVGEIKRIKKNQNSLFWDVEVRLYTKSTFSRKIFLLK